MIKDLVYRNRSYRRFFQDQQVRIETLEELVDLARHSASGANLQSLKYVLSGDPDVNERIFKRLGWAAYLKDWKGPAEGEKPAAYIVILGDTRIHKNFFCDHGIACQSILLGAVEKGLGGCILASIDRDGLRKDLGIDDALEILLVVALGRPQETVRLEYIETGGSIRYWRDEKSVHHVPKRPLPEIIIQKHG